MWSSQSLPAKFFGAYDHTLDPKGRLILPAKYRASFQNSCYITPSQFGDSCLVVWVPEVFALYTEQIEANSWADEVSRRRLRIWTKKTFYAEIDKAGRLAIPQNLRSYASLVRDVSVQGAMGFIELWDPDKWAVYEAQDGETIGESGDE